MQRYVNSLQVVVRRIVRQVLEWGELRLKKITLSYDAEDNPAELIGIDGTICYRKGGGSCVEIGDSSVPGLWELGSVGVTPAINPISWQDVVLEDVWMRYNGSETDCDISVWLELDGGGGGTGPHDSEIVEV